MCPASGPSRLGTIARDTSFSPCGSLPPTRSHLTFVFYVGINFFGYQGIVFKYFGHHCVLRFWLGNYLVVFLGYQGIVFNSFGHHRVQKQKVLSDT